MNTHAAITGRVFRWIQVLACAVAIALAARAAEELRRRYDLPAGDAARMLRQFAEVSGREVLFAAEVVRGVRTAPVRGEFTALEALQRLLAGTNLHAIPEERSGAIAVRRIPDSKPARPSTDPPPETTKTDQSKLSETPPVKNRNLFSLKNRNLFSFLAGWLAAGPAAGAQTASAPPKEEAVQLSPFTVNAGRDTGYQATSTLAGTRLNTPIKDIGASISVYTKDFLNDIGATNSNDLLIYATGMDAAGPGGNFSGSTNSITAPQIIGDAPRVNPQGSSRGRGLAAPTYTRGFFVSDIALDGYNTDRVTVNRGPNAILFGVGSAAGVVDTGLIAANLRKNTNKVEYRYGNNDSQRRSFDFNRVLVPDRLAFRLAALDDAERFNQRPAFEDKRRIFGTATFEPFRTTALRASFETGHTNANRPLNVLPQDATRAWIAGGRQAYDWSFYDDPARNPAAAAQNAGSFTGFLIGALGNVIYNPYASPKATSPDLGFRASTIGTNGTTIGQLRNGLFHAQLNRDSAADTIQFYQTLNVAELAAGYYPNGIVPAGIKTQGFYDFSAFPWDKRLIDEDSRQSDSFHTATFTFEQRLWRDRIGVEIGYNTQRNNRRKRGFFFTSGGGLNYVRIDPNVTLPDGRPNPNVGRPFTSTHNAQANDNVTDRATGRATAYLRYDFKELSPTWGKWMGRHTLTALREEGSVESVTVQGRYFPQGVAAQLVSSNPAATGVAALLVYLGPSVLNGGPLKLESIRGPAFTDGQSFQTTYVDAPAGSTAQGQVATTATAIRQGMFLGQAVREVIHSKALNLQSYWLNEHLITTAGWRRDQDYLYTENIPTNLTQNQYGLNDFKFPSLPSRGVSKEVKSFSAVVVWPQKWLRLPAGAELSAFVNTSGNFTPLGGRTDTFNRLLPSPAGETRELGGNLGLFDGKLTIRIAHFRTTGKDQGIGSPALSPLCVGINEIATAWYAERNINPAIDRTNDINALMAPLDAYNWRSLYQWRTSGSAAAGNLALVNTLTLPQFSDTVDYVAKGTEMDLVFNPTRQWRILFNVASQETVQSNVTPVTRGLVNLLQPTIDRLGGLPRFNYPAGYNLGEPLPTNVTTLAAWWTSNVLVPHATMMATEGVASVEQRKWRVNLVTSYSFSPESRMRGFSVGAGVRWQDKLGIGYPTSFKADRSIFIDTSHPFYAPPDTNVDAWVGYGRKLWRDRIDWKVQLNVRNIIGGHDPIPITVQPWGETAMARLAPERRWYLTNTFGF
jgi:outer membrane receptor protein involved in Fe transport